MRKEQIIPETLQELINEIESQDLNIAEVNLKPISSMPEYKQVIRIKDTIINLTDFRFIPKPKRILIHNVTGEELDLKLPVPEWDITKNAVASIVNEEGNRIMLETNYYETTIDENSQDEVEQLVETKLEPYNINTLKYLTYLSTKFPLNVLFQMFLKQYVDDLEEVDPDYFTKLK